MRPSESAPLFDFESHFYNSMIYYPFHSLEDYLNSRPLDVDGVLNDGWGSTFPVKAREIEATVLFADIGAFSLRTYELSPIETLIFVNNFFAWMTAEGLRGMPGIVDKYIGDEMMIVYSKEFGSKDPVADAIHAARWMMERDSLAFCPHIGIATGRVAVGLVGTPLKYNCSVFGRPVALAARCCALRQGGLGSSIFMPAVDWGERKLDEMIKPRNHRTPIGDEVTTPHSWTLEPKRTVEIKNMPELEVIELRNAAMHWPSQSAEDRAKASFAGLVKEGTYHPWRYSFEPGYPGER